MDELSEKRRRLTLSTKRKKQKGKSLSAWRDKQKSQENEPNVDSLSNNRNEIDSSNSDFPTTTFTRKAKEVGGLSPVRNLKAVSSTTQTNQVPRDIGELSPVGNSDKAVEKISTTAPTSIPEHDLQLSNNALSDGYINYWLGDEDFKKCFEIFEERKITTGEVALMDPTIALIFQLNPEEAAAHLVPLNLSEKRFIIIPVNNSRQNEENLENPLYVGGSHWSLLIFSTEDRQFYYVDTLVTEEGKPFNIINGEQVAINLINFLNVSGAEFTIVNAEMQKNGNDCGVYVLAYIHNFLLNGYQLVKSSLQYSIQFVLRNCIHGPGEYLQASEQDDQQGTGNEASHEISQNNDQQATGNEDQSCNERDAVNSIGRLFMSHFVPNSTEDSQVQLTNGPGLLDPPSGRRIAATAFMFGEWKNMKHGKHHADDMQLLSEHRRGANSIWLFQCTKCDHKKKIYSDPSACPNPTELDGHDGLSTNVALVSGTLAAGIGFAQLRKVLAAVNIPCMTENTFMKREAEIRENVMAAASQCMLQARLEEVRYARETGNVDAQGRPLCAVITDGQWSQRSYNKRFSAKSGSAAIIGFHSRKVLFVGVRNTYCCICSRSLKQKKKPPDHDCSINWTGSATEMEADIILEGFKKSRETENLTYNVLIGDGDSSVIGKLREKNVYGDADIEKLECCNHLTRNLNTKLSAIRKNTQYPFQLRRLVAEESGKSDIVAFIGKAIDHWRKVTDISKPDKIEKLKQDIRSSAYHALGNHRYCRSNFCDIIFTNIDFTSNAETKAILEALNKAIGYLYNNADSLIEGFTNNLCEEFNAVINTFIGGKRIFHSQRHGYETRVYAAALSWNTGEYLRMIHKACAGGISPGFYGKKVVGQIKRKRENTRKRRLDFTKFERRDNFKTLRNFKADENYGKANITPDVTLEELKKAMSQTFEEDIRVSEAEIVNIEAETRSQSNSEKWHNERKKRLTASNFGKVMAHRSTTSVKNKVNTFLYPKRIRSKAVEYGKRFEGPAIDKFCVQFNKSVSSHGFLIDAKHNFLGASPDGIVENEEAIVEVKCPYKARNMPSFEEAFIQTKLTYMEKNQGHYVLKPNSEYFFQIQGTLNITQKKMCYFIIFGNNSQDEINYNEEGAWIQTFQILVDTNLWETIMVPKLERFYMNAMLPEIALPRFPERELPGDIREELYIQSLANGFIDP